MAYKVLHVVRPAQGGMKRHLEALFAGLNRNRYLLSLAAPPTSGLIPSLQPYAQRVYPVPIGEGWHPSRDWHNLCRLREIIRDEGFDLIHTHGLRATVLGQAAALLAGNHPVVATIHNFQQPSPLLFRFFQSLLNRVATSRIITVSQALKQEVCHSTWTPEEKVTVIYNGINPALYQVKPLPPVSLGITGERPVVGTVARLEPNKGIRYLIEAIPLIEAGYGPVDCLIVGDGPERESLEKRVRLLKPASKVIFLGFRADIPQLLPLFDVVVVPSLREGLSIFCLEALAGGRPVVASGVGGIPEIIRDEETGILVPPADPGALARGVISLLSDRELAGRLADSGQQLVARDFSQQQMLQKTEAVYEGVLAGKEGRV